MTPPKFSEEDRKQFQLKKYFFGERFDDEWKQKYPQPNTQALWIYSNKRGLRIKLESFPR